MVINSGQDEISESNDRRYHSHGFLSISESQKGADGDDARYLPRNKE